MNTSLTFYRIISILLLVAAALLGIAALFALLLALSNPALLLSVFIVVAVVIYSFTSFFFLQNGIGSGKLHKSGFKDLIKVNAYVAMVFVFQMVFSFLTIQMNPQLLNDQVNQVMNFQNNPSPLPAASLVQMMKVVLWILFIYALLLGFHIFKTFQLLKQFAHLFVKPTDSPS